MVESIAIGLGLGIIAIGALLALFFGLRNISYGKSDLKRVIAIGVPFVIFGIAYAATGTLDRAGMATFLIMMALMGLGILVSSVRRTFNF